MNDLAKIPLEGSRNVFKHKEFLSLGYDIVIPNPLDHSRVSPLCSLPSPSLEYHIDAPIDNPMICDAVMD